MLDIPALMTSILLFCFFKLFSNFDDIVNSSPGRPAPKTVLPPTTNIRKVESDLSSEPRNPSLLILTVLKFWFGTRESTGNSE